MKKKEVFIGIFLLVVFFSPLISSTIYYVNETGDDSTGDGSAGNPWASLYFGCENATTSGDVIHVGLGEYNETSQCSLSVGVNIEGEGSSSIIRSFITGDYIPLINMYSASEGTNGNQTISNIKFDGNNQTTWGAILIRTRSNISIHDVVVEDFNSTGVTFSGKESLWNPSVEPVTYATGNLFYNNLINNSAEHAYGGTALGGLQIGGQEGILIYNNTIIQNSRSVGYNGYNIKYFNGGFNRGMKIYNNTLLKASPSGNSWDWNFVIEMWNLRGGVEIYNNTLQGAIDLGGVNTTKGSYDFAADIYDNEFGYDSLQTNGGGTNAGIYIERNQEGPLRIRQNLFKNLGMPLQFYPTGYDNMSNIFVYYNIFSGVGNSGGDSGARVTNFNTVDGLNNVTLTNFTFLNNIFDAGEGGAGNGIVLSGRGNTSNFSIKNNIFTGFAFYGVISNLNNAIGNYLDNLSIENNLFYSTGTNFSHLGDSPTNEISQNNIDENPYFVNSSNFDYSVFDNSSAIDAGLFVGLTEDYEGVSVGNPPNIGAFETIVFVQKIFSSMGTNLIDDYNTKNLTMTFDFKSHSNVSIDTIKLFSNFSGSWESNHTNSSYTNNTWLNISVEGVQEGYYVWGVWSNDSESKEDWSTNRTFTVDRTIPLVTITSPTPSQTLTNSNVSFAIRTNEASSCNYTLDSGTTNYTMVANESSTGFSAYRTLSNAAYIVNFYCTDSAINLNGTEVVSFTVSVTQDPENEGSPGGGGDTSLSSTNTEEGEDEEENEEESQTFFVNPDDISNEVIGDGKSNISSRIKLKKSFFKNIGNAMVSNSILSIEINFKKFKKEFENSSNITIHYTIEDFDGNIYFEDFEIVNIEEINSFYKDLDVHNLEKGKYVLEIEILNAGEKEFVKSNFKIRPNLPLIIALIAGLIGILVVVFFLFFRKSFTDKRKIN